MLHADDGYSRCINLYGFSHLQQVSIYLPDGTNISGLRGEQLESSGLKIMFSRWGSSYSLVRALLQGVLRSIPHPLSINAMNAFQEVLKQKFFSAGSPPTVSKCLRQIRRKVICNKN